MMSNFKIKKIRFIERDFLFNRIKNHSEYITDAQINSILDEIKESMCDLTFNIYITGMITRVAIYDNNLEEEIGVKDLNYNAEIFYRTKVQEARDNNAISKILQLLSSKKAVV